MKTISLLCNQCGAPLQVPESVRFVTCVYCKVQLKVHHGDGAAYTEILQQIHAQHEEISERLETIEKQNAIEQLDREWMIEKERLLADGKGPRSEPNGVGRVVPHAAVALFGIFWIVQAVTMGAPAFMILFGFFFVGTVIVSAVRGVENAGEYRRREHTYSQRRSQLLKEGSDDS